VPSYVFSFFAGEAMSLFSGEEKRFDFWLSYPAVLLWTLPQIVMYELLEDSRKAFGLVPAVVSVWVGTFPVYTWILCVAVAV
jgi:hypothetical protein